MLALGCDGSDKGTSDSGDTGGVALTPDIAIDVATLDFGAINPGSNELRKIKIENRGDAELSISAFIIDPDWGWIKPQLTPPFPVSNIAPLEIYVECKPDLGTSGGVSNLSGTLRIQSNDPDEPEIIVGLDCEMLTDADGDGIESLDVGGDDCNDNDPDIYPGAPDEWYDGIDSDCAGNDDYDQDYDGFRSVIYDENYALPSGSNLFHPTKNSNGYHVGGDCQDNNNLIYPDYFDYNLTNPETGTAPGIVVNPNEIWYDGIDHNCDEVNDYDQDGDGYSAESTGRGSDCDDLDPLIQPGADEKLNGADDDCDDTIDQDVPGWNSDETMTGTDSSHYFGYAVTLGDMDLDGYDDIIASAPGYGGTGLIAVYDGSSIPVDAGKGVTLNDGQNWFASSIAEGLGSSLAYMDDTRGTGKPALAIGAAGYSDGGYSRAGIVYVGPAADFYFGGDIDDAFLTIEGSAASQEVGAGLVPQAELNGDGINDHMGRYTTNSAHALWLQYGGVQGSYTMDTVSATFTAGGSKDFAKRGFGPSGDLNGDGYGDMVFCDPGVDSSGKLWVLWGSATRYSTDTSLDSAGTELFEGNPYEQLGKTCGIGPDTNNDGADELWVHVIDASDTYSGIYSIPGSEDLETDGQRPEDLYSHRYVTRGSDAGSLVFGHAGDWDNDGIGDVVFGLDKSGVSYGRVWIFGSDTEDGEYTASSDAYATIEGDDDAYQEKYGSAISPLPGDINNDGMHDFLAGDAYYDGAYSLYPDAGAIYIYYQTQ
ncbi:MAG: hypothetical protein ACI8S6_002409 [Myxococcota bacterium]|jgi:hypothetical protein